MTAATRSIRTLIAIHEEQSGLCVAYPVLRPEWAAHGTREDVKLEIQLFLEGKLPDLSAREVARLHLPPGARAERVSVPLSRDDLPFALRPEVEFELPCAILPRPAIPTGDASEKTDKGGRDAEETRAQPGTWAVVLPLRHALYIDPKLDLHDTPCARKPPGSYARKSRTPARGSRFSPRRTCGWSFSR